MSQRNISYAELTALVGQLNSNSLLVRQLQSVCGNNGLARGGVKAELRNRIVNRKSIAQGACISSFPVYLANADSISPDIQLAYNRGDSALFYKLKGEIESVMSGKPIAPSPAPSATPHRPDYYSNISPMHPQPLQPLYHGRANPPAAPSSAHPNMLSFKPSPFYEIQSLVGKIHECPSESIPWCA